MPFMMSAAWVLPGKSDRLRAWYEELSSRPDDVLDAMSGGSSPLQETAFILGTDHGDLLCVFEEVRDAEAARSAELMATHPLHLQHIAVMDETTVGGAAGRMMAECHYGYKNPRTDGTEPEVEHLLSTAWLLPGKTDELRAWYRQIHDRPDEVMATLDNELNRQEVGFVLPTDKGDLLAVSIQCEDFQAGHGAFLDSPHSIDREHLEVMAATTVGGSAGRKHADLVFRFDHPDRDKTERGRCM